MDEDEPVACVEEAPWWLDVPPPPDVDPADLIDLDDMIVEPLTVAETLIAVSLSGPGPEAQRLLSGLAGRDLSPDDALSVVQLWEAQEAWLVGEKHLALVGFAGRSPTRRPGFRDDEALVHELAPAWCSTVDHAGSQILQARLLSGTLSATGDLLRAGVLSPYKAWLITDRLGDLPAEAAQEAEARVLATAVDDYPRNLSRKLRAAVLRADPAAAATRHREGRKDRTVTMDTAERLPGLLGLQAYLPPGIAIAVHQRLAAKAAEWAVVERAAVHHAALDGHQMAPADGDGDPAGSQGLLPAGQSDIGPVDGVLRTQAQRMADALGWFVLGPDLDDPTRPREPHVMVHVTVDLPTLLALRDNPADLDRFGPLPPDIARDMATDADWQLLIHDPVHGHLLNHGTRRYRPGQRLRRHLTSRDRTCRYPGSSVPANRCDLDHTIPHQPDGSGGVTSADNMATLSRRAHRAKTFLNFTYRHLGHGVVEWTTPLGRSYQTRPHDYRGADRDDP